MPQHARRSDLPAILIAVAAFSAASIAAGLASPGFLDADAATHYMYARFAIREPHYLLDLWGRPMATALYALPASLGGRFGVHIAGLALAIACAIIAYQIARGQGYEFPALAFIFTLAQPLVFLHSFSEMTELPAAVLIGLGFWAYQKRAWAAMAVAAALAPLARPEGFVFLILAAVALIGHRRFIWLLILPLGLIAWSYLGWRAGGEDGQWWRWLINAWPWGGQNVYEPGPMWHFLLRLPMLISPLIFPAMWIGVALNLREGKLRGEHRQRVQWLIAALPLAVLVGHSALYWLGKFSSNGELRYLLIVSPLWAILAARGWEWVFTRLNWRRPIPWAAAAAVFPVFLNFINPIVPVKISPDLQNARHIASWYQNSPLRQKYPRFLAMHSGIFLYLDISQSDRTRAARWPEDARQPPPGTIFFWDREYAAKNANARLVVTEKEAREAGWIEDSDIQIDGWRIFLSPSGVGEKRDISH